MDSEKKRVQKKSLVGENLASEFVPMEHHEKRGNKIVTVMKETPYAYVVDLKGKILDFVESCYRYTDNYFFRNWVAIYKFTLYSGTNFTYVLFISSTGLLTWHGGMIPEDKIFVKLGGDHGQKSIKLAFQLANVPHPNSTTNTVVFSLYEGKDTRNNLRIVTQCYRNQLESLVQTKWQ